MQTIDWQDYHTRTALTAVYGHWPVERQLHYIALGLVGEVGELLGEIKRIDRDDNGVLTADRRSRIVDEAGDVLWYTARLMEHYDYTLDLQIDRPNHDTAETPSRTVAALHLAHETGLLAGTVLAAGWSSAVVPDAAAGIVADLEDVLDWCDAGLGDAARANLAKVERRLTAGTLAGSGGSR